MTIGSRIRKRREELGISQSELARRVGYSSRSSINKIELDERQLTQSKIAIIADALYTSPGYIMGWEKPEGESIETDPVLLAEIAGRKDIMEIVRDLYDMNDEQLLKVKGFIDYMKFTESTK